MKQLDPAAAQRVWQRVRPPTAPELSERETLFQLHRLLLCDQAALRRYATKRPPAEQILLRRLEQAYAEEAACLRGILRLTTGVTVKEPTNCSPTENLVQCYRNALTRLTAYSLRTADPLCAPAFRQLEHQAQQHCTTLLTLIGLATHPQK